MKLLSSAAHWRKSKVTAVDNEHIHICYNKIHFSYLL